MEESLAPADDDEKTAALEPHWRLLSRMAKSSDAANEAFPGRRGGRIETADRAFAKRASPRGRTTVPTSRRGPARAQSPAEPPRAPPDRAARPPPPSGACAGCDACEACGASRARTRGGQKNTYAAGDLIDGKYELVRVVGEGGMGEVWLARNIALDVPLALKLIRREIAGVDATQRLFHEARAAARLDNPFIVRVFDFGTSHQGDPFIAMELLEGDSLAEVLGRSARLSASMAVRTLLPVAEGLEAAHRCGVVHRDLKPANVMLVENERGNVIPKLVDFGIAKSEMDALRPGMTMAGVVVGSPEYMSPEQARGETDVDARADVWAFCVMLYEVIVGAIPFHGKNYNALLRAILGDTPRSLAELGLADDALWAIVERGLAKDVSRRWNGMRELGVALASWAIARSITTDVTGAQLGETWLGDGNQRPRADSRVSRSIRIAKRLGVTEEDEREGDESADRCTTVNRMSHATGD